MILRSKKPPRILVLVNGDAKSAAAHRARVLLEAMPTRVLYRRGKARSALRFFLDGVRRRPDVVYVMDAGWSGVLAAWLIKVLTGSKLVVDTGDAIFALSVASGRRTMAGLAATWLLEQLVVRQSDHLVVRSRYHRLYILHRSNRRVTVIPDCVAPPPDLDRQLAAATRHRRAYGASHALVVGMVGTLTWNKRTQTCYGMELVEALAFCPDEGIVGVVIGDGDGLPRLQDRARQLGVDKRLTFAGRIPLDDVYGWVAACDVCISTQTDDLAGWVRTTGKLPLYLMCQRYVLASDVGQASWVLPPQMLVSYNGSYDPEYPARLAKRLTYLARNRGELSRGERGLEIVSQHFDPVELSHRLTDLLRSLAD